jgi:hypothetical protein
MSQYLNNYVEYGWGDNLYGWREKTEDKFWFKYKKPCTQRPMSWRDECIRAADLLYQSTDKKILVHLSGGIDSEIICRSFLENGHPFEVSIGRFGNGLNDHDVAYAVKFCKQYDIKYKFCDMDMLKFIETDFYPYKDVPIPNPLWQFALHKLFIDEGYGFQVFGEGHLYLSHDLLNKKKLYYSKPYHFPGIAIRPRTWPEERRLDDDVYLMMFENSIETMSYMDKKGVDGCYLFYAYTPEIVLSYLMNPLIQDWLTYCQLPGDKYPTDRFYPFGLKSITLEELRREGHRFGGNNILNFKLNMNYGEWPELEPRPKWSGMEYIDQQILIDMTDRVSDEQPFDSPGNEAVQIPYDKLVETLRGVVL